LLNIDTFCTLFSALFKVKLIIFVIDKRTNMKSVYNKSKIDSSKYVNIETGIKLDDEIPDISFVSSKTDLVIVHSDEYVIIDSKALAYIWTNFSHVDVGRIMKMSDMVSGSYNVLADENDNPHTKETLMIELDYARNKFALFMKKLYDKSVIYYIKGVKNRKEYTHVMLNPTLARKSKTVHKECLALFDDLRK